MSPRRPRAPSHVAPQLCASLANCKAIAAALAGYPCFLAQLHSTTASAWTLPAFPTGTSDVAGGGSAAPTRPIHELVESTGSCRPLPPLGAPACWRRGSQELLGQPPLRCDPPPPPETPRKRKKTSTAVAGGGRRMESKRKGGSKSKGGGKRKGATAATTRCLDWCDGHKDAWEQKCRWASAACNACPACGTVVAPAALSSSKPVARGDASPTGAADALVSTATSQPVAASRSPVAARKPAGNWTALYDWRTRLVKMGVLVRLSGTLKWNRTAHRLMAAAGAIGSGANHTLRKHKYKEWLGLPSTVGNVELVYRLPEALVLARGGAPSCVSVEDAADYGLATVFRTRARPRSARADPRSPSPHPSMPSPPSPRGALLISLPRCRLPRDSAADADAGVSASVASGGWEGKVMRWTVLQSCTRADRYGSEDLTPALPKLGTNTTVKLGALPRDGSLLLLQYTRALATATPAPRRAQHALAAPRSPPPRPRRRAAQPRGSE